jgi:tetrahydromethanopterin S-methyltransferase subunit B
MPMLHPQVQQVINLFLLLVLGKYFSEIYLSWGYIIIILLWALLLEHGMLFIKENKLSFFSFSSLSTAIGVMLMLATPHSYIYIIVLSLGLFQKHFLTIEEKHFFNPSNFALLAALLLFYDDSHIVLGQLGDSLGLKIFVVILALSILIRVSRWVIPITFILVYIVMQYLFIVQYDPVLIIDDIYHRFYSVSFIVFILFMLTDPKTTPIDMWAQIGFSIILASAATVLDYFYGFRVQHVFMALFMLSIVVPFYSLWEKSINHLRFLFITVMLLFLALGAIIYIETKPPYYFEMNG